MKYNIPNVKVDSYDVITNKVRVTSYRAPGSIQGAFCVEQHMDMMAQALKMDPLELRMKNSIKEGDLLPTGERVERMGLQEIYRRIQAHPHWTSKLEGPNRGRGLAVGFWGGVVFTSGASVMINRDGTATVLVGSVDLTGTRTAIQQMAAELLEMSPEEVLVKQGDTATAPYADLSGGSRITYSMSGALHQACNDLLSKLKERAAERLKAPPDQIEYKEKTFFVRGEPDKKATLVQASQGGNGFVMGTGSVSKLKPAPTYAAALADVEVDPESGKVQILRFTAFQDVGKAVNPTRVEAQMQGAAVQSLGWGLWEEYVWGDDGVLRNASLLDYRQGTALDVPMLDCEIIEVPAIDGPFGVRGVGEVPHVAPAAAVANAIARAAGIRCDHMPMNPERIYFNIKNNKKREQAWTIRG
jgi:CO/xanthine dehydrogenase Mo-binding subunit